MPIGKDSYVAMVSLACAVCLLQIASGEDQPGVYHASSSRASAPVKLSLSDSQTVGRAELMTSAAAVEHSFSDLAADQQDQFDYPFDVSHDPGHPTKPLREKPGDINVRDCPPERYGLDNAVRAGNPDQVACWARFSLNENYSVWYVGGGTPWFLLRQARSRTSQEGTWGADYSGLLPLRRVWLKWSCDRSQGGLGAYATDRESVF